MPGPAIRFPVGRIRPAEAEQDVLRGREVLVAAEDLDHGNHDIEVVEEVQIDVGDAEVDGRAVALERDPHALHVAAPEDADRRLAGRRPPAIGDALAFAVEHALHVRQEVDELGVVPLLEGARIARELVHDLVPGLSGTGSRPGTPSGDGSARRRPAA